MIECPDCQAKHPENALFCDECGAYLLAGDQMMETLLVAEATWREREEADEVPGEEVIPPLRLKLTILDSGRSLEIPLTKEVSIGRLDPANASFPEIDFTSDGGLGKGISRRHAKVTIEGGRVFIQDLGSINGTFINGKRLAPYLPEVLNHGDQLQLGKLLIEVELR